ncbi:M24 family metallopeptidase [Enterovirga aerilata]|uniref:Aminopeptidase P family protein n=1 Tax=Enterovirga aerilata TaxID=2730920 RepID=A0A849I9G4_9HYPH|nr:Xaa-Pro peptidase family protein [Enterovirga sp. DB1703]NNM74028.1 aminopeptidase P family protein [Enterovirga sp. DB1703]
MLMETPAIPGKPPFAQDRLDELMAEAGIDVILATSRHNTRYLLGGYSFFFFSGFDSIGISRYLPIVVYFRGRPDQAIYVGNAMEGFEKELGKFWTPEVHARTWSSLEAIEAAIGYIRARAPKGAAIGIEPAFIPADATDALKSQLLGYSLVDGQRVLELLRAIKSEEELALVKTASESVVSSMLAVMRTHGPGNTKNDLVRSLIAEETKRGLAFEYCLTSAGTSLNRSPSDYVLKEGDIYSLDSGGNYGGYIGDLCRMAVLGDPDEELQNLLGEVLDIQAAARGAVADGAPGREIYVAAEARIARSPHRDEVDFIAHGMGLVSHEAPRLASNFSYPPDDAGRSLRAGMVISIETAIKHPRRGFIKVEDTVAITHAGQVEGFGDSGREWTRGPV